ncbi:MULTISPECIES: hypothetical protein [Aeromonas]|uniref:hypothetical protein n=1 Tax=Aeromonas TaxID=642 RepID=UPI00191E2942|nr:MULTISPECIES: hypothetical protein [Aeromonas]MBL0564452.1 hypothetical protein [Aeromonas veronii]QXB02228.1 hypothetical protein I6L46_02300 [Aeromonas sp. FDAARGOS 1416]
MKNSHETGWALLLLGAALLLVQTLPARYWPDNARLLAIFSHPVKGEAAEGLAWREWQDHSAATRMALRAARLQPEASQP